MGLCDLMLVCYVVCYVMCYVYGSVMGAVCYKDELQVILDRLWCALAHVLQ